MAISLVKLNSSSLIIVGKQKKNKNRYRDDQKLDATGLSTISKEQVLTFLRAQKTPQDWLAVSSGLDVTTKRSKRALSQCLAEMLRTGDLLFNRREQYCLVEQSDLITGVVIGHADGFGFLKKDKGGDDLFLPSREMRSLMNGDRVVASAELTNRQGKVEARVVEVIERKVKTLVGRFFDVMGVFHVESENKRIFHHIFIPVAETLGAKDGQIVLVQMVHYPSLRTEAIGKVVEVMGDHLAPGMEIEMAVRSHDLPYEWPKKVLDEAQEFTLEVLQKDIEEAGRVDLRSTPFVTIDGADARDFDDAVYCKPTPKGWKLFVAIADVGHYVKGESAIDKEAFDRGNSVYFPGQVIPMLPEVLSNGLCSLNPHVNRLAMVCEMRIDLAGQIKSTRFYQAVIYSHARLTYDTVGALLDNSAETAVVDAHAEIMPALNDLFALYQALKSAAEARGTLDFDTVETRFVFDQSRKIKTIEPVVRHDAHRLIEMCMIAANTATARFLAKNKMPNLLRVHDGPGFDKLTKLRDFLAELGLSLGGGEEPEPLDFKKLVSQIKNRPDAHLIQMVILRTMSQAMYSPEEKPHFGLALDLYSHFTSPIRRYPDLLTHRAIKHVLKGLKPESFKYNKTEMVTLGEHCSHCGRRADEASREVESWLKCEFMMDKIGQEFTGIVSSVTSFGLFIELDDIYIDGLIHVTALGDDYYHFDPVKHRMLGERTNKSFRLGDSLKVIVVKVNLDDKKIDLALVSEPGKKNKLKVKRKKRKRR